MNLRNKISFVPPTNKSNAALGMCFRTKENFSLKGKMVESLC